VLLVPEAGPAGSCGWWPYAAYLASRRSLFYVTDDDRADQEAEWLIRTAGFEPVRAGGIGQSSRHEVGGDLHGLVVGLAEARSLVSGA
jgi:8-hydroxy-5-deazaflavin:NADPH oxidoreductase